MPRATILLCTHNLVPKNLFTRVLEECVFGQARTWNCDIVIVSHYPVLEDYVEENLPRIERVSHPQFQSTLLKEPLISREFVSRWPPIENLTNLVVGERKYSMDTLCDQMALGVAYSKTDNIIVMEHDVLYPSSYTYYMSKALDYGASFCCWRKGVILSSEGYFKTPGWLMFSRISWRRGFLGRYLAALAQLESYSLEPEILSDSCGDTQETFGDYEGHDLKAKYAMVDDPTGEDYDVLDVKHGLNSTGNIVVKEYYDDHPKWGNRRLWVDLVDYKFKVAADSDLKNAYGVME